MRLSPALSQPWTTQAYTRSMAGPACLHTASDRADDPPARKPAPRSGPVRTAAGLRIACEGQCRHAGRTNTLNIDPATLAELLADPALAETMSAVAGCPLVVVGVDGPAAGQQLAGLELAATPAVVVVVTSDPAWL